MARAKKMSNEIAKEQILSVIRAYECMSLSSPDVSQRVYRKVWLSAKDIEAMRIAIELLNKEVKNDE